MADELGDDLHSDFFIEAKKQVNQKKKVPANSTEINLLTANKVGTTLLSAKNTPQELCSFWMNVYSKLEGGNKLSQIEYSDKALSLERFLDCTTMKQRTLKGSNDCDLEYLLKQLQGSNKNLLKRSDQKNGAPSILIFCQSAIRCVNVIK